MPTETTETPVQPETSLPPANSSEWIYRGVAAIAAVLLIWLAYRNRYNLSATIFLIAPLIIGALVIAARLDAVSNAVHAIENWLTSGSAKAAGRQGKFARFVQHPFFAVCLAIFRWTAPIPDSHLRAGLRLTALIFFCGVALTFLVTAAYLLIALAVVIIVLAIALFAFSLWAGKDDDEPGVLSRFHGGGKPIVNRPTTDWLGNPKTETTVGGKKVGETTYTTDWLGNPKEVHKDTHGNVIAETKSDTDWLGNSVKTTTDPDGNVIEKGTPTTDWLGNPKTVYKDPDGNIVAEEHRETDWLGQPQNVREEK